MSRSGRYRRAGRGAARVSATDAAKHFGRLVDRVREDRATYVIERGGQPVARIGPVERASFTMSDFKDLARGLPGVGEEYPDLVERAVARHNRPRIRRNPWER
jgi:antitoxin (DNA-binding transcriptional repressor) of toxin-antitoxin stability system